MSAISAFVNPIKKTNLLTFYNTKNLNIALQTREGKDINTFSADGLQDQNGRVLNPSSMAGLQFKDLVAVYGMCRRPVTNPCKCQIQCQGVIISDSAFCDVCLLSPAFKPLGLTSEPKYARLAASQDTDAGDAWIYYRNYNDDLQKIREYTLTDESADELTIDESHIADQTYLAAYFDSSAQDTARHIVFQLKDNSVQDYNVADRSNVDVGLSDAYSPTGLATVHISSKQQTYLYYSNYSGGKYHLRRAVRPSSTTKWSSSTVVDRAPSMAQVSQISVTPDPDLKANHIVYTGTKGTFENFVDKW